MGMGRPREFDMDRALDHALEVFWRNGYEGTSIAELTQAMGINPPSLYAAFGNKEELFRKALQRYVEQHGRYWDDALAAEADAGCSGHAAAAPTARGMVRQMLREADNFLSNECNRRGCLMVPSVVPCSAAAEAMQPQLASQRSEAEARVRARLERAKDEGLMPPDLDPGDFARYVMAVMEGMAVRAAGGAGRQELEQIGEMALRTWPA